jgi:hypothetical protein
LIAALVFDLASDVVATVTLFVGWCESDPTEGAMTGGLGALPAFLVPLVPMRDAVTSHEMPIFVELGSYDQTGDISAGAFTERLEDRVQCINPKP